MLVKEIGARPRIALVTSREFPRRDWVDQDLPVLTRALIAEGAAVDSPSWDDDSVDWSSFDTVVLHSPWSGWIRQPAFMSWIEHLVRQGARLINPAGIVKAGMSKAYLLELSKQGIPIVPTDYLSSGIGKDEITARIHAMFPARTDRPSVVVKPAASGGSIGVFEFGRDGIVQAVEHIVSIHDGGGAALVQPYMSAIDVRRELGVITIGPHISHAISKAPILHPGSASRAFHPDARPYGPLSRTQAQQVDAARSQFYRVAQAADDVPAALRFDFIPDSADPNKLYLLEVESVAPVKFFSLFPAEARTFAQLMLETVSR